MAQGRLRRDRTPLDAPIDAEILTRNFIDIALRDEYSQTDGGLVSQSRAAPCAAGRSGADAAGVRRLDRHGRPPRLASEVADFAGRLSDATRHPVSLTAEGGNFTILVLTEDERRPSARVWPQLVPGIPAQDVSIMRRTCPPRSAARSSPIRRARPPTMPRRGGDPGPNCRRCCARSCIHEELAQGMGLANDSPGARPSIFNDDEEFALLTRHDELLLRILYDPRLRPGMSEAEAAPIVRRIANRAAGRERLIPSPARP